MCRCICCESPEEVADDVDALVLVTEWQQLSRAGLGSDGQPDEGSADCLDGRNALDRARLERFGFRYLGIAG